MTTETVDLARQPATPLLATLAAERLKYAWLLAGLATTLLSVGGRWDIPLAAWIAPIFLLRFARLSRPATGLLLVWAVSISAAVFWGFQLGVRVQASTLAGHVAFGTMYTLPYVLDRLMARRLGLIPSLFLFPAAVVAAEFLMANLSPLGTAYGMKAITQAGNLSLVQVLALTGPYTIGFLMGWLATAVNAVWEQPGQRGALKALGVAGGVLIAVIVGGAARIAFFPVTGEYVRMAGITPSSAALARAESTAGGIPTSPEALAGADPAKIRAGFDVVTEELLANTRRAARAGAQVVVWSETAARTLPEDKGTLLARAAEVARQERVYVNVALGIPFAANETHLIAPDGKVVWSYGKKHPVPGMEPVPPASSPVPVAQTPFGRLTNVICFDADFPALTRVKADIMIVPGADWPEIGRVHTLKMASLRAIENGYSLLRQDFNGQSAAFDPHGHVLASQDTTTSRQHLMMADVPTRGAPTLYNLIGDVFAWLCLAAVLGLGVTALRGPRAARG